MKLKEIPPYLYQSIKLNLKTTTYLNNRDLKEVVPVIVSHTTIPSRVNRVHLTVRSILNGNKGPKKMILWLHESFENNLPKKLEKLQGNTFEVRYSPYTFSHRKLIHTLKAFPNDAIVTVDDDMMYPQDFLEKLYIGHTKYPKDIVTHYARQMKFDDLGRPIHYHDWSYTDVQPEDAQFLMPVGVFGVLYPPNVLDKRVFDLELMLKLSPKSDDLWFKTMSYLKGNTCRVLGPYVDKMVLIIDSQKVALKKINNNKGFKQKQWGQLIDYFNIKTK